MTLFNNRILLEKKGFLYKVEKDINHSSIFSWHADMSEKVECFFEQLKYTMFQSNHLHTAIVSSENMMGLDLKILQSIKMIMNPQHFDIFIIAYIRNQVDHIPSHYLQKQKDPFQFYQGNIENFFRKFKHIYGNEHYCVMNNYAHIFGFEKIIVRIYDKENLIHADSVSDFFHTINLGDSNITYSKEKNTSLLPELSKIIEEVDKLIPELLNKTSKDYNFRQNIFIDKLLKISEVFKEGAEQKTIELLFKELGNEIKINYGYEIWKKLEEIIMDSIHLLYNDSNNELMNEAFKKEVLNYYQESNYEFSKKFLDDKQKRIFLKYYNSLDN